MPDIATVKFQWQLNYKVLAFAAFFFPVTMLAGIWQLDRAEQKQLLLDQQSARMDLRHADISEIDTGEPQQYLPARVRGVWTDRYFLLENQVRNGRPGYEVIGLFQTETTPVLINRGWIETGYDRLLLPEVDIPQGTVELTGYLYQSLGKPFTLGEQQWTGEWPERLAALEWEKMVERVAQPVFPYMVRLEPGSSSALTVGWEIVNLPPERHVGYAVQWFAMAAALLLLTLFASSNLWDWFQAKRRTKKH